MKSIAKKAAKFTFIGLPKRLIGWDQIKANNRLIADLWRSVRTPVDTSAQATRVREQFAQLRADECRQLLAGHVRVSRFWWGCAAACLVGALYMIANQAPLMVAVNWLAFAVLAGVFGLKRSYRAWQVETGTLFQQGAFRHFVNHERWFR
ncbi:hypothetical protein NY98_12340 [Xanthomonas citri pv. fuscans]|uniref:Uncharacterized protein n=1 Tax=Xanthomonas citri pv. fuscans TaxID=366649 RepID=A0AB34Q642_XANCI|nr:hypothetical protein [Xanthomonas citri]ATS89990.1 hypothetical protein XcfCFBP6167P_18245 [Xanthomonas citri pv. phaseoli var. fuscans]AZU17502.1 hypothetical protein AC613_10475 [Xanthomonas citri pv. fuscans]AZU21562.1 hypothetical protein AC612_10475 [Xanthomonas citri pv. fuscans]AZU92765.1 hypothetical protein AC614_10480 [Xanthomonas citri pv. fuscans]KGU52522.1 hypothetical protein NY98_12340 [Xanthomonas citri pv. fuscans]